jgi:hypothetical protein
MKTPGALFGNPAARTGRHRRGTILVFALVVLAVAAIAMSGWVFLMGSLAEYTERTLVAVERRIELENSRALALQYLRGQIIPGTTTNAVSGTFTWGSYTLGTLNLDAASGPPLEEFGQPSGENPYSPAGNTFYDDPTQDFYFRGYSVPITGTIGEDEVAWRFAARSRTPVFGYDVVSLGRGGSATAGIVAATGNSISTTAGPELAGVLLNIASPPEADGLFGPNDYFEASSGDLISPTTLRVDDGLQLYTCDGSGAVTIYLKRSDSQQTYYISGGLTSLTFSDTASTTGIDNSNWAPIRVVCDTTLLTTVSLPNGNQRRLLIAMDNNGSEVAVNPGGSAAFRLVTIFRDTPAVFQLAGNTTMTGGIISNSAVRTSGNTLTVVRDLNPRSALERLAARRGWVEATRND